MIIQKGIVDKLRMKNMLNPILDTEHRQKIYLRLNLHINIKINTKLVSWVFIMSLLSYAKPSHIISLFDTYLQIIISQARFIARNPMVILICSS